MEIKTLTPGEWAVICSDAHLTVFNEIRDPLMDRIDYALVIEEEGTPLGYLTAREFDSETVYWQFGGAFPTSVSSAKAVECYRHMVEWALHRYKRIVTYVENENVKYLKLAMHFGFRIIGCRIFNKEILVELMNEGSR